VPAGRQADDEEFHFPGTLAIAKQLLDEGMGYLYCHNNVRQHSALACRTHYRHLMEQLPDLDESIRLVVPILLDNGSTSFSVD
jgi:hypothetical protein